MPDVLAIVVGGCFTLLGGYMGVTLSAFHSKRAREEERQARHVQEQKDHAVELVDAGRAWASNLSSLSFGLGTITDPVSLTGTDTWKMFEGRQERYRRALIAAELVFRDANLQKSLREIAAHRAQQETVTTPIFEESARLGRATDATMQAAWTYCGEHESLLTRFIETTRHRLST